jgi:hypothetical protein
LDIDDDILVQQVLEYDEENESYYEFDEEPEPMDFEWHNSSLWILNVFIYLPNNYFDIHIKRHFLIVIHWSTGIGKWKFGKKLTKIDGKYEK